MIADRTRLARWLLVFGLLLGVARGANAPVQPVSDLAAIRLRAENSDPEAQNALGNAYTNGLLGLPQDYAQALVWYHRAAESGFAPAQFNLGLAYELGRGLPVNETAAFSHYLRAAEQGFGAALFNVGNMYSTGRGVRQDLFEANLWYKQAADKGIPEAQFNLGLAYESGRGVMQDEEKAAQWYRRAAERGFALAQYNLGLLLEDGRGVAKDEVAAAQLYRAAAEQGLGSAQNNYGLMLHEGRGGLPQDQAQALFWLTLSVENGVEPLARDAVAKTLTAEQSAAARRLLEAYRSGAPGPVPAGPAVAATTASQPAAALPESRPPDSQMPRLEQARVQAADPALVDQLRDQVSRLASQVLSLTAEKNAAEEKLATLRPARIEEEKANRAADAERFASLLRQADGEISRLKRELISQRAAAAPAGAAADQLRRLENRVRELEAELRQARSAPQLDPSADPSTQLGRLQEQIRTLQGERDELEKWVQVLELSVKSNPGRPAAETELAELKRKLAEAEEMLAATQLSLAAQIKQEEKLKVENSMLTYRFQRAEEMLAAQLGPNAKPADLVELKREAMDARQTVEKLTQEKEDLTQGWMNDQHNLKKAQARITDLERELAQAWKKVESAAEPAATLKPVPVLAGDQLFTRQQMERLMREHENATALLTISKQALGATQDQVTELTAEIERLHNQLKETRADRTRTTQNPSLSEGEQTARIAALLAENDALAARLAKAQGTINQIVRAVRGEPPAPPLNANITAPAGNAPVPMAGRFHVVREGDSLARISEHYYGTVDHVPQIRQANADALQGGTALRVGQRLVIP